MPFPTDRSRNLRSRRSSISRPASIPSATAVDVDKVRRRRSMRRQSGASNKENERREVPQSPGPTPYWKVAKERGSLPSPPKTRSAKKKKTNSSNTKENHGGLLLTFSPPDQVENERRERQALKERQELRDRRVEKARHGGQLLVFSPSNNPVILDENTIESDRPTIEAPIDTTTTDSDSDDHSTHSVKKSSEEDPSALNEPTEDLADDDTLLSSKACTQEACCSKASLAESPQNESDSAPSLEESPESRTPSGIESKVDQTEVLDCDVSARGSSISTLSNNSQTKELSKEVTSLRETVQLLNTRLEKQDQQESAEASQLRLEVERLRNELSTEKVRKETEVATLEALLEETKKEVSSSRECEAMQSKIDLLVKERDEVAARSSSLEAQLATAQASHNDQEGLVKALRTELGETTKMLRDAAEERDHVQTHLEGFDERERELYRMLRESDKVRRHMHSRIMQLMGNIRVFIRVRPVLPDEALRNEATKGPGHASDKKRKREEPLMPFSFPGIYDRASKKQNSRHDDLTKNLVEVREPSKDRGGLSERQKVWSFGFDGVFSPQHSQDDIWEATEPMVQCTADGFNVCLFAYGQTGSGKTFTMLGEPGNEGIIGRAVRKLFASKEEIESLSCGESSVALSVELLEVYNEKVRDLLGVDVNSSLKVTSKEVVGNVVVQASTQEEVMRVLSIAQGRRCVKATASNSESSRSHLLFTIHFTVSTAQGEQRTSKLNICDLAGSERLKDSGAHHVGGALLEETKHINKSLHTLSSVIERLQQGEKNVSFRDSKLTFLLKDSLSGDSKTLAIVCCNPLLEHVRESVSSLRFAEKVNRVELKAITKTKV